MTDATILDAAMRVAQLFGDAAYERMLFFLDTFASYSMLPLA